MSQPVTADPVILGYDGMTLRNVQKRFTRQSGSQIVRKWKGPYTQAEIMYNSKMTDFTVDDMTLDQFEGSSSGIVTAVSNEDNDLQPDKPIWTIGSREISKDLRQHPYFNPSESIIAEINVVEDAIKKGETFDSTGYTWTDQLDRYYAMRMKGIQSYITSMLILKKSYIITARSTLAAEYANVNRVVPIDIISPPDGIIGDLQKIPTIPMYSDYDPSDPADVPITESNWEWLKKCPDVKSLTGGQRYNIDQEWWGAERWSTVLYGGSWDPINP